MQHVQHMDERAYHLQPAAHLAVAKALKTGKLFRKPCEECGNTAQAHHDSYYPEKWLDVRWLCGKHHRAWHQENQPIWPTIYEYHPSDFHGHMRNTVRVRPWFREQNGCWYVQIDRVQTNLGRDKKIAFERFEKIKADREAAMQNSLPRQT